MTTRAATRIAWIAWGVTLGFAITHLVLHAATPAAISSATDTSFVLAWLGALVAFQSFATVGAIVASRIPSNPIGWLYCACGVLCQLANAGGAYTDVSFARQLPGGAVSGVLTENGPWVIGVVLGLVVPLYLVPTGAPLTRRWRPVLWALAVWVVAFAVVSILTPGLLRKEYQGRELRNPIGVEQLAGVLGVLAVLLLPTVALGVVAVVLRYRRSRGEERQQLRVFVVTTAVVLCALVAITIAAALSSIGERTGNFGEFVVLALIALVPVSMGVAILRYRLYELDRIVSRTLVYGALTVILGAAYVGLVLAGQALFSSFAGGSNLTIAASTLVVAALFLPVRARVQRFVDRRFYRRRYDAQRTLYGFGTRLREQIDLETLRSDLGTVVEDTMQPAHVSLWLRREVSR